MALTFEQVLTNAIAAELAAAAFYDRLAEKAADDEAMAFCREMAAQEVAHARAIEKVAAAQKQRVLTTQADPAVAQIETAPEWEVAQTISYRQGLEVALETELHAADYYAAIADFAESEAARFLRDLAAAEEQHAERIRALLGRRAG